MQELDEALADLASFSHVAFTSRNGAQAVLQRLASLHGGNTSSPGGGGGGGGDGEAAAAALAGSGAAVWALGADAGLLRDAGLQIVNTPAEVRMFLRLFSLCESIFGGPCGTRGRVI